MNEISAFHINEQVEAFFRHMQENFLSPSYEEVRLIPAHSEIHPSEVSISGMLTREISLATPIVSAAMDTVTESEAAIAMAKAGGIGILHKNFHLDPALDLMKQIKEVGRVKHHLHALIGSPVGFSQEDTLEKVLRTKHEKDYGFDTFVVYGENQTLAGLITHSVIKYNRYKLNQKLKEIMIRDVVTREECSLKEAYELMLEHRIGNIVLTDPKRRVTGMYTFTDVENAIQNLNRQYTTDNEGRLRVGAAVGPRDMERVAELVREHVDVIVLDSAHGDSREVIDALKVYKSEFPDLQIIAGNVSTGEGARNLIKAGADAIKVGQGPGRICSTRVIAGIGVMQPDAIFRAASEANRQGVPVIADGGIQYSGDLAVAMACGANCVMMGQALAGCKESPGEVIHEDGKLFKVYRGMASLEAMSVKKGSDRYQKEASELKKLVPEGITKKVPFKGHLADQVFMLAEGLRTGLGYCGSKDMPHFKNSVQIHRITAAGIRESHPDTTGMLFDQPNYSRR
ncbi:IMP dehydrogenase [bacterium]|nr:IMP dehydrogenase [bacterium]